MGWSRDDASEAPRTVYHNTALGEGVAGHVIAVVHDPGTGVNYAICTVTQDIAVLDADALGVYLAALE